METTELLVPWWYAAVSASFVAIVLGVFSFMVWNGDACPFEDGPSVVSCVILSLIWPLPIVVAGCGGLVFALHWLACQAIWPSLQWAWENRVELWEEAKTL